ncbi:hypothetical protein ES705_37797 [subsurface metagenome]
MMPTNQMTPLFLENSVIPSLKSAIKFCFGFSVLVIIQIIISLAIKKVEISIIKINLISIIVSKIPAKKGEIRC